MKGGDALCRLCMILLLNLFLSSFCGTSHSAEPTDEEMILTILIPGASSEEAECMLIEGRIFCKEKESITEWKKKYLGKEKEDK